VDADLMRAACVQVRFDKSKAAELSKCSPIRARFTSFAAASGHARPATKIAGYRKLNPAGFDARFSVWLSVKESDICLLNKALAEGCCKLGMGGVRACDDDGA
jgi:hypothetical protein